MIGSPLHQLTRRRVLVGAMTGLGTALLGCSSTTSNPSPPNRPTPKAPSAAAAELSELETRFGGRIGVFAVDTGSGDTVRHRADERFLMTSTFKTLAVSAILRSRQEQPGLLDRVIRYDRTDLLEYAPVTTQHVADGMTVSALCDAAITRSDNTAANLLLEVLGGPRALTGFVRTLGDSVTRLDRIEPEVNYRGRNPEWDTTTPARIAADLRALALGNALDPAGRDLLVGWLKSNTTGDKSIRAGLPADWQVGDKTGSGEQGEVNDIAVVWPPNRPPLVVAIYTAPNDPETDAGYSAVASAARIVAKAFGSAA